tara:strand:- start:1996 stop:2364 length:369 start_codon:yes stop_codon:yes gene_type:complete
MITNYELAGLASEAAVEIDNYLLGRSEDLSGVYEFSRINRENILEEEDFISDYALALWKSMGGKSSGIRLKEHLALQMRLFSMDLDGVERLPRERLEELRSYCVEASRQFMAESRSFKRYAA